MTCDLQQLEERMLFFTFKQQKIYNTDNYNHMPDPEQVIMVFQRLIIPAVQMLMGVRKNSFVVNFINAYFVYKIRVDFIILLQKSSKACKL